MTRAGGPKAGRALCLAGEVLIGLAVVYGVVLDMPFLVFDLLAGADAYTGHDEDLRGELEAFVYVGLPALIAMVVIIRAEMRYRRRHPRGRHLR